MEDSQQIRFQKPAIDGFDKVLKQRVAQYFEQNKLSKYGNFSLYLKTVIMFAMYLIPFFLINNLLLLNQNQITRRLIQYQLYLKSYKVNALLSHCHITNHYLKYHLNNLQ